MQQIKQVSMKQKQVTQFVNKFHCDSRQKDLHQPACSDFHHTDILLFYVFVAKSVQ
jgi:hypothetical protein